MTWKALHIVFVGIVIAELRLTSCQNTNGTIIQLPLNTKLPMTYRATVLQGGYQVCPTEEQLEMARADITQDSRDTLLDIIPCLSRGQIWEKPAVSCLEVAQCNSQLPSEYYWITSSNGTAIQVYCDMTRKCSCSTAAVGGWSRVAYINMTDPTHECPPAWMEITEPVRTCGRANQTLSHPANPAMLGGCSSAKFSTSGISYTHVCGRILGYQFGSPDAFHPHLRSYYTRIEDPYFDGVVVTHGTDKEHIWTFAASASESDSSISDACPCTNVRSTQTIPTFVGEDYFCETAISGGWTDVFYPDDPLWDGENCGPGSTCCEFNDPPYFCKSLSEATTDDIEVRICADESLHNEDTPVELVEIFVQ